MCLNQSPTDPIPEPPVAHRVPYLINFHLMRIPPAYDDPGCYLLLVLSLVVVHSFHISFLFHTGAGLTSPSSTNHRSDLCRPPLSSLCRINHDPSIPMVVCRFVGTFFSPVPRSHLLEPLSGPFLPSGPSPDRVPCTLVVHALCMSQFMGSTISSRIIPVNLNGMMSDLFSHSVYQYFRS